MNGWPGTYDEDAFSLLGYYRGTVDDFMLDVVTKPFQITFYYFEGTPSIMTH